MKGKTGNTINELKVTYNRTSKRRRTRKEKFTLQDGQILSKDWVAVG